MTKQNLFRISAVALMFISLTAMRCQHGDRLNTKDANPGSLHNSNDYYDGSRKSYQDDNKTAGSGSVDGPSASSAPVATDTAKAKTK